MRILIVGLSLFATLGIISVGQADDAPTPKILDVWPSAAPGEDGSIGAEKPETKPGDPSVVVRLTNVTKPIIKVFRPTVEKDTGAAILVFPGGGYNHLAWDHEGEQVARWLNSLGVTGIVLKYRVPRRAGTSKDEKPPQALADAQRALSLVRSKASDWGIDAKRIGVLGFSAGGHLGAWVSTNSDHRAYSPVDDADKTDCRPDFTVLIYPGGLTQPGTNQLSPEIHVTSKTPPVFLAHANDDPVSPENSAVLYIALKQAGVPTELHIYASGGHGFGMRKSDHPISSWTSRCEDWLRDQRILKPSAKP